MLPNTLAIETRGLQKSFGSFAALQGLDLRVQPGTIFGFLGPNGAGKTTALGILAGLSQPTSGEALVCGLDTRTDAMQVRERIGFLRQDPRFYTWMTGRETLQFTGKFFDLDDREINERATELLALVDLSGAADRKMGGYSGGMRQRLGIAQALMGRPDVLLLDEPCSALDPAGRYEVIQIMDRLRGSTTVFYSTHILQDVERVADEVAIISRGRCIRQDSMRALLSSNHDELVIECYGEVDQLADSLRRQRSVLSVNVDPKPGADGLRTLNVNVASIREAQQALPLVIVAHADVILASFRPHKPDLEAVFLELTGGESGDIASEPVAAATKGAK